MLGIHQYLGVMIRSISCRRRIGYLVSVFLFSIANAFSLQAQDGPGGVGRLDGTGSIKLWLDADSATFDGADKVTGWNNLVDIPELNMSPTTANNPNFISSKFNSHAAVSFENVDDALGSASTMDYSYFPENQATTFTIVQHDNLTQQASPYATLPYETNRFSSHMPWNGTVYHDLGACCGGTTRVQYTFNSNWLTEGSIFAYRSGGGYSKEALRNNVSQVTGDATTSTFTNPTNYTFEIGQSSSNNFRGDMAEFLMFNVALNDAQMTIVHNYLAAKYNLTIVDDFYLFQTSHGNDVIGIGQNGTDVHVEAKSSGILTIKDANALGDGDYVFAGHGNAEASSWTTNEQINGDTNLERIAREWRFDATGTPGTITISIDPTNLPAFNLDFGFYTLWIDNDGDFTSGATQFPLTQNGSEFEATGITVNDGMFVTIAAYKPEINFTQTAFAGKEDAGDAVFQINIDYPVDAAITVDYTVSGTCTEDLPSAGTFAIASGSISTSLNVSITSGDVFEPDETIILTLTPASQSAGTIGSSSVSTYTVKDDGTNATNLIQFDAPFSYSHKKAITINKDMVAGSTDLVDFPVMIRLNGADFTEMEPNIQSGSGYDIRFTYENSVEWLEHQIELYDAAGDEYIAWVKLPTLSASVDTKIEVYYGNASISTDPSLSTVFEGASYEGVWHLGSASDGSANAHSGTINGSAPHVTGFVGNALSLNGTNQDLAIPNISSLVFAPTDNMTMSIWYKGTDTAGDFISMMNQADGAQGYALRYFSGDLSYLLGEDFLAGSRIGIRANATENVNDDLWHYIVVTYDGGLDASNVTIYKDGNASAFGSIQDNTLLSGSDTDPGTEFSIGSRTNGGGKTQFLSGIVDEARIARSVLSPDWIKTEFNNMSDVGTLITAAAATATSGLQIAESTDTLNLTIALNSIDANDVSIDYAITSGTATSGVDYMLASGTATITAGNLSYVIVVDLSDDSQDETDETFTVSLSNPVSASSVSLGTNDEIEITLIDDDTAPEISLGNTVLYVNEGSQTNAWEINLSSTSGNVISVDYTVSASTATSGVDYIHSSGTVTIPSYSLAAQISFNIIDDEEVENTEVFDVLLANPVNATLNPSSTLTININDNDNFGINGPGGVGKADGSGTLVMWMIADSVTSTGDGTPATFWENSINVSNLNLSPTGASPPTYVANVANGHAGVSFSSAVDDRMMSSALSVSTFPYNEGTVFLVTTHDNLSQQSIVYGTRNITTRFNSHMPWNGTAYFDIGNCCVPRVNFSYQNEWVGEPSLFSNVVNSTAGQVVHRNGVFVGSDSDIGFVTNHTAGIFGLGITSTDNFAGDIMEFIMYTRPVNEAQRIITENYLAAKYFLDISNDYYAFETTHSTNLVGIGQADATNFHTAAQSAIITISNASTLGNGDYVMVGNDYQSVSIWDATDVPSNLNNIQRVAREWRVDVTGTPGTISVAIDPAKLPALPVNYTEYVLMTDGDGLFNTDAKIYPMTLVSGEYVANNVVISQGTYFTIGVHRRTIEFVGNANQDFESINNKISLSLSLASGSDISIPYTISGTATSGSDYTIATSGSFVISAGNTLRTIDLGIIDESIEENDETIIVTLGTAPSGTLLGTNTVFTYTINDDDKDRSVIIDHFTSFRSITINSAQVSGSNVNFPVLISIYNDADLSATSGSVGNSNGFDIVFYDSLNGIWLDHDLEYYFDDGSLGDLDVWVKIPSLTSGADVNITMFYGNSGIEFDQSSSDTWDANFTGVWHMDISDLNDGTNNGANGFNQGGTSGTGTIGLAAVFNGSSNIKVSNTSSLAFDLDDSYTISSWYKGTGNNNNSIVALADANDNSHGYDMRIVSNTLVTRIRDTDGDQVQITNTSNPNDNNWHYVVTTYNGSSSGTSYVDASSVNSSVGVTGSVDSDTSPSVAFTIGSRSNGAALSGALTGTVDEVRISNTVRSADWITTEYNNINNLAGFISVGTHTATEDLTVAEDVGTVNVTVRVNPIDDTQSTTINYGNIGTGTALSGSDFMLTPGVVTIPAGEQTGTFTFEVTNDLTDEQDETIDLEISGPSSNAKLGTVNSITYTIQDDDDGPEVSFVDLTTRANEGTSVVFITVQLDAVSGNNVTIDYASANVEAIAGSDYVSLSGTLTIPAGTLVKTISFQPIDDAIIESPETMTITLSNPVNATLSLTNFVHTVTIADNDNLGFEGPGGVGSVKNTSGEKFLKLWLIADSVNSTAGKVTNWKNIVQNIGVDYTMIPVGIAPDVVNTAVNGHKEISFNNVSDALVSTGALSAVSFPGNELSIFIVTETDNLGQSSYAYATDDNVAGAVIANSVSGAIPSGGNVIFDLNGTTSTNTYQTGWAGNHSIFSHIVSSDTLLVYRNNTAIDNTDPGTNSFTNQPNYKFYLGKDGASGFFQGDIAEVIMFSRDVNLAQINLINNYLAARYNLTIANDFYNYEVSHGNKVAGIGRVDANNQHVAALSGIVTISNASDLDDGEYVIFGNDNASIASWSSAEIPAVGILRTQREWRFDKIGSPGSITMAFNTDLLPSLPNGNEDYIVMIDTDGDFTSGATVLPTVFVDGQYKASNVAFNAGDYVTFGIVSRTISFAVTNANGAESAVANAKVNLSLVSSSTIELDYTITGGTATGSSTDYSLAPSGKVTFIAGQTSVNIPLGIINDALSESDETIVITLSNPPAGVSLANSVYTYTIKDDDNLRKIHFNAASAIVAESAGTVTLTIEIENPIYVDAANPTTAFISVTGGTAEASPSPDYTFAATTVTIPATQSSVTFNLNILDDVLSEADETIIISLSSPTNANLGTNSVFTYTITDNDAEVTVQFQNATTTIDEGGSVAGVIVELSATSGQDVQINYAVTGGTAINGGVDFALAAGTLTIEAGNQLGTINVSLTDDGLEESAETVEITLSGEDGATLGTQVIHTISITDNDAEFGYYGPGGVGNSESNMLWLDAYYINGKGIANVNDGSSVTVWKDRSGNGYDFMAIGTSPTFDVDAFNLKNTVVISSSAQGFQAPSGFSNALSNYSFIAAMKQSSGNYLVESNTAATAEFRLNQGTNGIYALNDIDYLPNANTANNITTWIFDSQNSPMSAEVFRNGTALANDDNFQVMAINDNFALGSRNSQQTQGIGDFAGNISEFIVYSNVINDAQRVIIENYLGNKYNLVIANDFYTYEGTYGYDIVGIGKTNNEQHLESMSDSLLMLSGASDLDNDEYVFMGHDNGSDLVWTTSETPNGGSNVRRLAREWRMDLTGTPGTVIFKIDTTKLPNPPTGYDQYVIWVDDDGDFRSGTTTYQVEYSVISGFHVTDEVTIADGTFVAIGVGRPVVQFAQATSSGSESATNPILAVSLSFILGEDATVNYAATGGSATGSNVDYLLTSGTLTITAGQTGANISLGIINDMLVESDETIIITLTTPSSNVALGSISEHTYTIHDNDNTRNIQYSTPLTATGSESTTTYTVTVALDVQDITNPTTVDLNPVLAGNYAILGDDYTLSATTLSIAANSSTITFDITIIDDDIFENDETITLNLTSPINAQLGANTQFVYTITDNDTAPVASFADPTSFVSESAGIASVEVDLSGVSVNDITIDYTVTATATSGADYTLDNGSLLILAGEISEDIQAVIVNDLVTEAAETITITLIGGTNATVAGTTVHVLTILDNDQAGSTGPGGVGDDSNNLLWLRGDNFITGTWSDISGNSNDFTGAGPTVGGTGINAQSTVEFDGTQSLSLATALSSVASDYDVFFVTDADVASNQILFDDADGIIFGLENSNGGFQDSDATWKGDEIVIGIGSPSIIRYNLESGSGLAAVSLNGIEDVPTVPFDYTATSIGGTSTLGELTGGGSGFDGEMGEMIVYNSSLNTAQSNIVNNYLSTRYDIGIPNDYFAYDDGTATNDYFYNLIGIGQEDSDNIHVFATSENFLSVSNPDDLDDSEYLMIANDGADLTSWTFAGAPANGSTRKVAREWRVDKTGDLGTVSFQIDTTFLPTPPSNVLTWALIVTSDGDFTTIDATYPLTFVAGDVLGVDGLDFSNGDYFSLALVEYRSTGVSLDFNNPLAWTTGVVPTAGTKVNIVDGHNLFLSQNTTIGSLTLTGTGSLDLSGLTLEFSTGCIAFNGTGSVNVNTAGSTIGYTNPNVTDQCVSGMTYNNIFTDGPSGSTKYLTGDIIVQGDIDLKSNAGTGAIFDVRDLGTTDDYDIEIQGDWFSEITFLARTGSVTFNGTVAQSINTAGGETFNDLIINKTSGVLSLSSGISTEGVLSLTLGNINLGANDLNINSGSSISGGGTSSYISADGVGVLRQSVSLSTSYTFPIGDSNEYSPFTFLLNSGTLATSAAVTINMRDTKHTNIVEADYISRYWSLRREGISGTINYDVSYTYQQNDVNGTEKYLRARKFSTVNAIGGSVTTSTNVLTYTGHTSFSDHTGESDPVALLPVELLYFKASLKNGLVYLEWSTASEKDNDYFLIQRSLDGRVFETIGVVDGNGNSQEIQIYDFLDENPVFGVSFYRLKQVDFDGAFEYSAIVSLQKNGSNEDAKFAIYPNPVNENKFIFKFTGQENQEFHIRLVDINGIVHYSDAFTGISGEVEVIPKEVLANGLYFLLVETKGELSVMKALFK